MRKFLLIAALTFSFAAPAIADTNHYEDTVTYIGVPTNYNSCISFQTTGTGGKLGFDNSSGGQSGHTGYDGAAQWNVIGVGTGTGNRQNQAGEIMTMLLNSRLSGLASPMTIDWVDAGVNSGPIYGDCNTSFHAAKIYGQ
jgi:hypothetical protein